MTTNRESNRHHQPNGATTNIRRFAATVFCTFSLAANSCAVASSPEGGVILWQGDSDGISIRIAHRGFTLKIPAQQGINLQKTDRANVFVVKNIGHGMAIQFVVRAVSEFAEKGDKDSVAATIRHVQQIGGDFARALSARIEPVLQMEKSDSRRFFYWYFEMPPEQRSPFKKHIFTIVEMSGFLVSVGSPLENNAHERDAKIVHRTLLEKVQIIQD